MTLTKRQTTLVAVFFLGLVGLGVDRVFLRPQGGSETAAADPAELLVPRDPPGESGSSGSTAQRPSVAARLTGLWPDQNVNAVEIRDPFSLPESWEGASENAPAAVSDAVAEFTRTYPLVAIVADGRRSYVLVGEQILWPGQSIGGFTLISVGSRSAVFERENDRVVLELAGK